MASNMNKEIENFLKSIGILKAGFCECENKSAIVCLFPYYTEGEGNLSVYARSLDYHKVVKEKLYEIENFLKTNLNAKYTESYSDIGPEREKVLAKNAGLGFLGKNSLIISPEGGSFFFIGYVLCDLKLEYDKPIKTDCKDCDLCQRFCVGKALTNDGFNINLCASAISQKKGDLTEEEIKILKKSKKIFGCDMCQTVCPYNKVPLKAIEEFTKDLIFSLKKEDIEGLSEKAFREKYKDRAFIWRGKRVIERNLNILEK